MSPRASDDRVRTWRRWGLWAISIGSLVLAICVLAAFAFVRHSAHPGARGHSRDRQRRLTTEILKRFVFERPALLHSARDCHNSYPAGTPRSPMPSASQRRSSHRDAPRRVVAAVLTLTDADAFGPERRGMRPALDAESRADAPAARRYVLTAIGAVGAGWIATDAVVLSTRASSLDLTHADAAFVWACLAIVGFAAIVFAALLMALRPALPRRTSGHARPVM